MRAGYEKRWRLPKVVNIAHFSGHGGLRGLRVAVLRA